MNDSAAYPEIIPENEARRKAESYLISRYHEFKQIEFDSCELSGAGSGTIYRLHGTVFLKSRSTLGRFVMDKSANQYKFVIEMNAVDGRVINYIFT